LVGQAGAGALCCATMQVAAESMAATHKIVFHIPARIFVSSKTAV
jgi:hypothetical protein